ncbi:MAG: Flp family type IVb pilin [Mesorhizobium sp.]|nr:Flp family type IVb pilin [Mesorhizobium sp.]
MFWRFLRDERGATAIEYGLIVACLSLAIVASIQMVGNSLEDMMINPARALDNTFN